MSTPTFGGSVDSVLAAQQQQTQRRQQQAENSARLAVNMFTYVTVGVGDYMPAQPIEFDCVFLREPAFAPGPVLVKAPDLTNYHLPIIQAGVLRWITKDLTGGGASSTKPVSSVGLGAPTKGLLVSSGTGGGSTEKPGLLETGDPNQQIGYIGAYMYFVVQVSLKDGMDAPPPNDLTVHHHLTFQEMAIKKIDPAVTKPLADDSKATALTSPLTAGLASA